MDWRDLFLNQHAIVHSEKMSNSGEWSMQDALLRGLTDEQMRERPPRPRTNSIAWLLWHMSRTEDVTVNFLLAGRPQVLDEEWVRRLGLTRHDIGTGMTDEEVAETGSRINIDALLDYRIAVGRRTREAVQHLQPEDLAGRVDPARIQQLLAEGSIIERAKDLATWWGEQQKLTILNMPATGHGFMHMAEAIAIRRELKF